MKNFWLDHKGPAKTRVNIWLSASVAADAYSIEEGASETLVDFCDIETAVLQSSAVTHKFISEGTNEMLCLLRVGKAISKNGLGEDFSQHLDSYCSTKTKWYKKSDWEASVKAEAEWEATVKLSKSNGKTYFPGMVVTKDTLDTLDTLVSKGEK